MSHDMDQEMEGMGCALWILFSVLVSVLLGVVLLVFLLWPHRPVHAQEPRAFVSLLADSAVSKETWPVILFGAKEDCNHTIVVVFYHEDVQFAGSTKPVTLVRSKTVVIDCFAGTAVMGDSVPVDKDKIAWVEVTFVKDLAKEKHTFAGN